MPSMSPSWGLERSSNQEPIRSRRAAASRRAAIVQDDPASVKPGSRIRDRSTKPDVRTSRTPRERPAQQDRERKPNASHTRRRPRRHSAGRRRRAGRRPAPAAIAPPPADAIPPPAVSVRAKRGTETAAARRPSMGLRAASIGRFGRLDAGRNGDENRRKQPTTRTKGRRAGTPSSAKRAMPKRSGPPDCCQPQAIAAHCPTW